MGGHGQHCRRHPEIGQARRLAHPQACSAGKPAALEEGLLLGRRLAAQHGVAVGEAAEARDDLPVDLRPASGSRRRRARPASRQARPRAPGRPGPRSARRAGRRTGAAPVRPAPSKPRSTAWRAIDRARGSVAKAWAEPRNMLRGNWSSSSSRASAPSALSTQPFSSAREAAKCRSRKCDLISPSKAAFFENQAFGPALRQKATTSVGVSVAVSAGIGACFQCSNQASAGFLNGQGKSRSRWVHVGSCLKGPATRRNSCGDPPEPAAEEMEMRKMLTSAIALTIAASTGASTAASAAPDDRREGRNEARQNRQEARQAPRRQEARQAPQRQQARQEPRRMEARQAPRRQEARQDMRRRDARQEMRRVDNRQDARRDAVRRDARQDARRPTPAGRPP